MAITQELARRGFAYQTMPAASEVRLRKRAVLEVIPKLTQSLLAGPEPTRGRPMRAGSREKIDDFLFPLLFAPAVGLQQGLLGRFPLKSGGVARLGAGALEEARRIDALPRKQRHEGIGAFVSGFQGALALAGGPNW